MTLSVINAMVCAGLFWTCFCRACRTNDNTYRSIRLALLTLGACAIASGVAPWAWGIYPTLVQVALTTGMLMIQAATARAWAGGVLTCYQRSCS